MTARVVLLAGASGSGKTSLTRRVGLPALALDDFYRDGDDDRQDPPLPLRFGIVDWDDPASWDADAALAAIERLCRDGAADVPVYDIPTSRRSGTVRFDLGRAGCSSRRASSRPNSSPMCEHSRAGPTSPTPCA